MSDDHEICECPCRCEAKAIAEVDGLWVCEDCADYAIGAPFICAKQTKNWTECPDCTDSLVWSYDQDRGCDVARCAGDCGEMFTRKNNVVYRAKDGGGDHGKKSSR